MADFIRSDSENIFSLTAVAPTGGVSEGLFYLYEDTWGIAFEDKAATLSYSLVYRCPNIKVPKAAGTGTAFAVGDPVYLNTTNSNVQKSATGGVLIGLALVAATDAATSVRIDMDCSKIDG
jgi:predicted RecA/RadA family phage recombinase